MPPHKTDVSTKHMTLAQIVAHPGIGNNHTICIRVGTLREYALQLGAVVVKVKDTAAQPETPKVTGYAADIIRLANGEITEREFCERQGRRPA